MILPNWNTGMNVKLITGHNGLQNLTQVWPYPQLAQEIIQKYQKAEKSSDLKIYTLAIHPHVYEGGKI